MRHRALPHILPARLSFCFLLLRSLFLRSLLIFMAHRPAVALAAGPPAQPTVAQIALGLRKLGVAGSILYIAAHPDDENTALLAYLSNGAHLRTAYLSLTRGDGGQNLIGSEQGPALGIIRTQELLAARRIDGAEQFFTRARDFGFSKSPDETLRIWGQAAVLSDVVAVIRKFRPDVIVTRFSPEPAETHGHHTASAMLALEAFHAAADPKFHPELLTGGVGVWQARRIFWNRSSFFIKPTDDVSGDVKLDVGGYNPLLGESYGEMAADSRSMHKSQGFGVARVRAPILEYFKLLAAAAPARGAGKKLGGILDGVDVSLKRFAGTVRLRGLIDKAIGQLDPAAPQKLVPTLAEIDAALEEIPDAGWRAEKRREVRDLIFACAGLFVDATATDFRAAPGTAVDVTATVVDRSSVSVTLDDVRFPFGQDAHPSSTTLGTPKQDKNGMDGGAAVALEIKRTVRLPLDLPATIPYWLETPPDAGLYHVANPGLIGAPERASPLAVEFTFTIGGRQLTVARAVSYKWTDPVMGERYRPLEVTPAVSVLPETSVLMFPGAASRTLTVRLVAGAPSVSGTLRPEVPAGWAVEPAAASFALGAVGSEAALAFQVAPVAGKPPAPAVLRVVAEVGGARLSRAVVRIEHAHIPTQTYLVDADVRLEPLALTLGGTKIGYLPGPGDEVAASLRRVGYDVTLLGDEALVGGAAALARFAAIVVGVRAFNTNERLGAAHALLMAYVEAGGTLVVQYNTNNRLAPLAAVLGPWPFDIGQKRVTDETAAVTFASPGHAALTAPNAIGPHDFDGWIQERGLYFADKWDGHYETPLAMHDPGEAPQSGSLLWARHGKGTFVYTGLAFFRQLPAGVPGAYRLFANLLAGGHPHPQSR
jgi:LmbE family N-acetylglucosaminyl deacetylase